jgi:hypothetical protein
VIYPDYDLPEVVSSNQIEKLVSKWDQAGLPPKHPPKKRPSGDFFFKRPPVLFSTVHNKFPPTHLIFGIWPITPWIRSDAGNADFCYDERAV